MRIIYERWFLTIVFIFLLSGMISTVIQMREQSQINTLKAEAIQKKAQYDDELEYLRIRIEMEKEKLEVKEKELELAIAQQTISYDTGLSCDTNVPYAQPIYPEATAPKEWDEFQKELHEVVPGRLVE